MIYLDFLRSVICKNIDFIHVSRDINVLFADNSAVPVYGDNGNLNIYKINVYYLPKSIAIDFINIFLFLQLCLISPKKG
jgi:hypothetical protein